MSEPPREAPRKGRGHAVRSFLVADRTPMWFTAAVVLAGAIGTYYLAPSVNAEFERQKIKTDFVIRNYSDLRSKMEDFMGLYATVTQKLAAGEDVIQDVYKLQEIMGRINAQTISLLPIFSTEGGPKAAAEVNAALNGMLNVIFAHAGKTVETPEQTRAYNEAVVAATQKLVPPLLELYVRIGDVGNLRPTEANAQLGKDAR